MSIAPKEEAIFLAVLQLVAEGRDLGGIRISEIAETAGIGKGTVYEYFPSRDDLLIGAVLYHRQKVYETIRRDILAADTFQARLEVGAKHLIQCLECGTSALGFFPQRSLPEVIRRRFFGNPEVIDRSWEMMDELTGYLLESAYQEKLIPRIPEQDYARMVIVADRKSVV